MAILPILQFPDPRLKEKSAPVTGVTAGVSAFIDDLLETMRAFPGCVGIAAPQIGNQSRIVAVDVSVHWSSCGRGRYERCWRGWRRGRSRRGAAFVREGCMS